MSEQLTQVEEEEGGQSMDGVSAVGVAEQKYRGFPPPGGNEGEALDKGSDKPVGGDAVGLLSGEGGDGHLEEGRSSVQDTNGESGREGEERDGDKEGSFASTDDEDGTSQTGAEGTHVAAMSSTKPIRLVQLPLARVKNIMKSDPDVGITSQDSIFLVAKATEQFVAYLAKELAQRTSEEKRKVVQRKDLDMCVKRIDGLLFLEGAID